MKAIIEKVRDNVSKYQIGDGSTMFVHAITVNSNEFEYHSKSEHLEKFKEGEEAYFELKDVETKRGISKRIVPTQAPRQFTPAAKPGYGGKFQPKNENRITWLSCFSSVCVLNQQSSKINDFGKILEMANQAYTEALKHND